MSDVFFDKSKVINNNDMHVATSLLSPLHFPHRNKSVVNYTGQRTSSPEKGKLSKVNTRPALQLQITSEVVFDFDEFYTSFSVYLILIGQS